jgi:hypothetical protein
MSHIHYSATRFEPKSESAKEIDKVKTKFGVKFIKRGTKLSAEHQVVQNQRDFTGSIFIREIQGSSNLHVALCKY